MKALFTELDLYKIIILASLVLMPLAGFWSYRLDQQIKDGQVALRSLRKSRGELEEIGKYMKLISTQVRQAKKKKDVDDYAIYFDRQIFRSAKSGLRKADFRVTRRNDVNVSSRSGRKTVRAKDIEVEIGFKRGGKDKFPLSREFIWAVLDNCERESSIWKLRELKLRNQTLLERGRRNKVPPPELGDEWLVEKMVFARREKTGRS